MDREENKWTVELSICIRDDTWKIISTLLLSQMFSTIYKSIKIKDCYRRFLSESYFTDTEIHTVFIRTYLHESEGQTSCSV